MRKIAWLYLLAAGGSILLTTSCASGSARYSESDSGKTYSQDLGTTFYVSLDESVKTAPRFSAGVLELAKDSVDPETKRRVLEFNAKALGETEIVIGRFSLRVLVTSASDRPGMHIHQH